MIMTGIFCIVKLGVIDVKDSCALFLSDSLLKLTTDQ